MTLFQTICYLSLSEFRDRKPQRDTVVVSILDEEESVKRPKLAGWRSALALTFEDTYEEDKLATAGAWPDEPNADEHARYCQRRGERIPALSDAKRIVDFVETHRLSAEQLHLVIHCHAGYSRSAAVASWASVRAWVPVTNPHNRPIGMANPRLLRLLDRAFQARQP